MSKILYKNLRNGIISSFLLSLLFLQIFITYGCNKNDIIVNPQPTSKTTSVNGSVNTNEIGGNNLNVQSAFQLNCSVSNGQYSTTVSKIGTQILFITDGNQQVRGLTFSKLTNNQPSPVLADAQSTAYSLIYITPGICSSSPDSTNVRLNRIQQLNSFQTLVTYFKNNLLSNSLNQLLTQQTTKNYLNDCIIQYWGIDTNAVVKNSNKNFKGKKKIDPDPYFQVTKLSGGQVELKNFNWRYAKVLRRDIKFDGNEKNHSEIVNNMGGGIPYSLGSILTQQEFQPTKEYDNNFGNSGGDIYKSEYWVTGPARNQGETPPTGLNTDLTIQTGATAVMYLILPAIDIFTGGAELGGNSMSDLMGKAATLAEIISTNTNIQTIVYNMLYVDNNSYISMSSDLLDLSQTALEILLEPPSRLVTNNIISFNTAEYLRTLLPVINVSFGTSNFIICMVRLWDGVKFSYYDVYTCIPQLTSPPNNSTNQSLTPTLTWNVATLATGYHVQVADNLNFTNPKVDQNVPGSPPQYTISSGALSNNTQYYWRVYSTGSEGTSSWSEVWNFNTQAGTGLSAPTLISPSNGATNQSLTPTLDWSDVTSATSYQVQVSTSSSFTSPIIYQTVTSSQYAIPSGLSNNTLYYWRANASNGSSTSPWSFVWNFTTQTGGQSGWYTINTGINEVISKMNFFNSNIGCAITSNNRERILKTYDGGNYWATKLILDTLVWLVDMQLVGQQTGFVMYNKYTSSTYEYHILKSINGGDSWTDMGIIMNNLQGLKIFFTDNLNGYITGIFNSHDGMILKTVNGGNSWNICYQSSTNPGTISEIFFPNSQNGYAVSFDATNTLFLVTSNGGSSWNQSVQITGGVWSLYFPENLTGYGGGRYGLMVKTTNGGISWNTITSLNSWVRSLYFFDTNTGYVGTDNGIYKTTDGGNSFIPKLYYSWVKNIVFADANTGYACTSDNGIILKTTTGGK